MDARSTRYASDLAKGFDIPIIHVNADDPDNCLSAVRLAMAYRQKFQRDVLIDLLGYRRHGHNESDEPAYTQPVMYNRIKSLPTVRELYAARAGGGGVLTEDEADAQRRRISDWSRSSRRSRRARAEHAPGAGATRVVAGQEVDTRVAGELLVALNEQLLTYPRDSRSTRSWRKQLERRRAALGPEGGIDWAHAEALALASLLTEGVPLRLTGQDTERGTFSQRHLVLHDVKTGGSWRRSSGCLARWRRSSCTTARCRELATLGFEYGYSAARPRRWCCGRRSSATSSTARR